ncbi:LytR/AlgR family response regulator transcription factor [Endozoicomonadaceae bacterium StTr2]
MKVLIADDEPLARDRLRHMLEHLEGYDVCKGEAGTGDEAVRLARQFQPDIILLDIRMPGLGGIEVAEGLQKLSCPPALVFCTAYDEYALAAFDVHAAGYLVKPVRQEELKTVLEKARKINKLQASSLTDDSRNTSRSRTHISARTHRGIELIELADIRYFIADNKYVTVHHLHGEVLIDETLKELENEFGQRFVRIHRNALVARDAIEGLCRCDQGQYTVKLKDVETPLGVSRRHVAGMRKLMSEL